jgi:dTDP-4-dehydrorhamnose reductase
MKLLVIGASGLVGSHVYAEALARGHTVVGTSRSQTVPGLISLDLAAEAETTSLLDRERPDWVVHAAGWTWVDGCEADPARAERENATQPAALAAWCRGQGARMVYFSTTYIFDGQAGPYDEAATPSPINAYARSKLAGEEAVRAQLGERALLSRVICVWGREARRKNFAYQVIDAIRAGRPLRLPSDQEGNPTWAGDIAAWTLDLIAVGESGPWNLVGDQARCLRGEWAAAIALGLAEASPVDAAAAAQWRPELVPTATLAQPAPRPLRGGGVDRRIQTRFPRAVRAPSAIADLL